MFDLKGPLSLLRKLSEPPLEIIGTTMYLKSKVTNVYMYCLEPNYYHN